MEEVWKDINLATLNDQVTRSTTTHSNLGGVILQDFLARPFTIDPPNTILSSQSPTLYAAPSSPAPPLLTALSLSSHPHLRFDPHTQKPSHPHHPPPPSNHSCFTTPTTASLGAKRFAEPDCNLGDRRNKRMIKNRESAARSRARKQAYTNELEVEVEQLKEENARLKRQQKQLSEVAASEQKKKGSLYRASTAPF
ncbi:protein FD-like [Vigna radiata var. radiata]|uniref:Protein FD-like n=1 Tax=Vigna radiata var. radiata TaxID=3916 RepID=A0A3Q0EMK6_VIGRR|nr:protein FD-like [Vigna radiata var. radiata]